MLPHKTITRFIYQLPVLKQIVGVGMGEKGGGGGGGGRGELTDPISDGSGPGRAGLLLDI